MKNSSRSSPAGQPLELDEFLCFAVYSAGHAFNRVYQPLLKKVDLTYPQFIAMVALWTEDGQTVGNSAGAFPAVEHPDSDAQAAGSARLHRTPRRDAADERQVRVHLTSAGRKLHLKASDIVHGVREATGLQDRQAGALAKRIDALRTALEQHGEA